MARKENPSPAQGPAQTRTQSRSPSPRPPKDAPEGRSQGQGVDSGQARYGVRRLAPPVFFLLALCLLVVFFYDTGYTSLPPTGKRYDTAKAGVETLRLDAKRANLREPWEKLAAEFRAIYDADPGWKKAKKAQAPACIWNLTMPPSSRTCARALRSRAAFCNPSACATARAAAR